MDKKQICNTEGKELYKKILPLVQNSHLGSVMFACALTISNIIKCIKEDGITLDIEEVAEDLKSDMIKLYKQIEHL